MNNLSFSIRNRKVCCKNNVSLHKEKELNNNISQPVIQLFTDFYSEAVLKRRKVNKRGNVKFSIQDFRIYA